MNSSGHRARAFISAGSNEGNRRTLLKRACFDVGRLEGTTVKNVSSIYLSKPVGIDCQNWFLNCVLEIETTLDPLILLERLEELESSLGRVGKGSNTQRTIDLDIILFGDRAASFPRLTIPHPKTAARRFVLEPLVEIAPEVSLPNLGVKAASLLPAVMGQEVVRVEPFAPSVSYRWIAVEGPIGAGKTSLAEKLAEYYDVEPALEMSVNNPFLSGFYEQPKKYAFATQTFFLLSRLALSQQAEKAGFSVIVSDYLPEKDLVFSRLNLEGEELRLYNEIRNLLTKKPAGPGLAIFLSAETDTLFKRTKRRGRSYEAAITEEYVDKVNKSYREWSSTYHGGPSLVANVDTSDFARDELAFGELLWKISNPLVGRETLSKPHE